jgi:proline dehydrogenase
MLVGSRLFVYLSVLNAIHSHALNATISVKPPALGLYINSKECSQRIEHLVQLAEVYKTSVCVDMEDVRYTQNEIDINGAQLAKPVPQNPARPWF